MSVLEHWKATTLSKNIRAERFFKDDITKCHVKNEQLCTVWYIWDVVGKIRCIWVNYRLVNGRSGWDSCGFADIFTIRGLVTITYGKVDWHYWFLYICVYPHIHALCMCVYICTICYIYRQVYTYMYAWAQYTYMLAWFIYCDVTNRNYSYE